MKACSSLQPLPQAGQGAALVESIVLLGRSLGKVVVAEGIETASQFDALRDMGCRIGQGYRLDRPLDPETATARVRALCATVASEA